MLWKASISLTWLAKALFVQLLLPLQVVQDTLFLHALCQNSELIFKVHLSPGPQFPFGTVSGNLTMIPVSSIKAFLKVLYCSDFLVHRSTVIILLDPRLCREFFAHIVCLLVCIPTERLQEGTQ